MTAMELLRLQRGAAHVRQLGDRATAELLAEIAARTDAVSVVLEVLGEFEAVTSAQIRAAGAGGFPPRLRALSMEAAR